MLMRLMLVLILLPLLEIWLLLQVGQYLGVGPTIAIVIITGILGAILAKSQGFLILSRIQDRLAQGDLPTDDLFQGLFVLVGGVLLLTPGLLSDIVGFLFLLPPSRARIKDWLEKKLRQLLDRGEIVFWRRI